jgi:hypothetical protein
MERRWATMISPEDGWSLARVLSGELLRFAHDRHVRRGVGGIVVPNDAIDHDEVAGRLGVRNGAVECCRPVPGAVDDRGLPEPRRRERQNNATPDAQPLGFPKCDQIGPASGGTDDCYRMFGPEQFIQPLTEPWARLPAGTAELVPSASTRRPTRAITANSFPVPCMRSLRRSSQGLSPDSSHMVRPATRLSSYSL